MLRGQLGQEAVLCRAGQVDHAREVSVFLQCARASRHDIRVEVDGVDGVGDGDFRLFAEDFLDVAAVALGAVGNKHLVRLDAESWEVVFYDFLDEEAVALLGPVAAEGLGCSHLVDRLVHGGDAGGRQGLRHVADAERDDVGCGILFLIVSDAVCDLAEEIAAGEFQIVFVDVSHGDSSCCFMQGGRIRFESVRVYGYHCSTFPVNSHKIFEKKTALFGAAV